MYEEFLFLVLMSEKKIICKKVRLYAGWKNRLNFFLFECLVFG
jgi:hypothetical protein